MKERRDREEEYRENKERGGHLEPLLQKKLVVRVHADNLPRYGFRKALPDTYVQVSLVQPQVSSRETEHHLVGEQVLEQFDLGQSEVIYKSCRPQWTTTFTLEYELGTTRYVSIRVLRAPAARNATSRKEQGMDEEEDLLLGEAYFEIGEILGYPKLFKAKRLPKGGIVFCRLERIDERNQKRAFRFRFQAQIETMARRGLSLRSPSASSAPDTFIQICRQHSSASPQRAWMVVYRSQPVLSSLNPSWDVGQLDLESLCNGDLDRPLRLSVWTHRASSVDTMVGLCETSLRAILNTQRDDRLMAIETEITQHGFPLRQNLEDAKQVGRLLVKMAQVIDLSSNGKDYDFIAKEGSTSTLSCADTIANQPLGIDSAALSSPVASPSTFPPALPSPIAPPATFQDYMKSWKVDLTVAIDFTSSNGDPRIPGTLHDKNPKTWNDYEETIVAIGNALAPYTGEGLLETAVWGFGCKFDGTLKNLFQCGTEAKVSGVYGILQAYQSVFQLDLTMSEPTCFHLVLQQAAAKAHKSQQNGILRYGVLLVITDGLCQDIREPKRLLQNYRTVPLSVIFVGLGRGDMAAMKDLVAPCSAVSRPNATFVDFRQHQQDPGSLGRSALQAVSSQLVGYMQQHNINP